MGIIGLPPCCKNCTPFHESFSIFAGYNSKEDDNFI